MFLTLINIKKELKIKALFKKNYTKIFFCFFLLSVLFSHAISASASQTNGTIDSTFKYAWGENIGWINFGCDGKCNVSVTDAGLSGFAWSTQYGWINLNPTKSGVTNNAEGVLSGYAWSSNLGWINFTGVTINTSGEFTGYATLKSDGSQINFNCNGSTNSCSSADFKVKTDWRPASVRQSSGSSGGGTSGYIPPTRPPTSAPANPPTAPVTPDTPLSPPQPNPILKNPALSIFDLFSRAINNTYNSLLSFFRPNNRNIQTDNLVQVARITPLAFRGQWTLLPRKEIRSFVFAPLPYEVRMLAAKFPELDKTLKSVGIERFSDLDKLEGVDLTIPGLAVLLDKTVQTVGIDKLKDIDPVHNVALNVPGFSTEGGTVPTHVGIGKIAMIEGLPLAKFPLAAKKNLPTEFVFARADDELVDLNVAMSIGDKGEVTQKISSLPGTKMRLVVKPISSARSVTGYFIFKASTPKITQAEISRSSLTASALFSMSGLVEQAPEIPIEKKLVLSSFEYLDPDHDGIYTADVVTPVVPGEYEVITVIDYIDPVLGSRKMSMITVIDPEGYVFEKNNGKETRIPSAIVSLYYLNTGTKKYELWDAKGYQQENPQTTDVRGTYSFLVPEGSYYFQVEAPGYDSYTGKAFVVSAGGGIHQNIELSSGGEWLDEFDWKTVLLIVVFLLLVYNLFGNSLRNGLSKFFRKVS